MRTLRHCLYNSIVSSLKCGVYSHALAYFFNDIRESKSISSITPQIRTHVSIQSHSIWYGAAIFYIYNETFSLYLNVYDTETLLTDMSILVLAQNMAQNDEIHEF